MGGRPVEEEFKYLNQHAGRLGVPEAMVQQVLKQELEKKGIDPATALVEGDRRGRSFLRRFLPGSS